MVNIVQTYIKQNPLYFESYASLNLGKLGGEHNHVLLKPSYVVNEPPKYQVMPCENNKIFIDDQRWLKIDDKTFDIKGHIRWNINIDDDKSKSQSVTIKINKETCEAVYKYLDGIEKLIKQTDTVRFCSKSMISAEGRTYEILNNLYTGPQVTKSIFKELKESYIDSFFHLNKESLWATIETIQFKSDILDKIGQPARLGLLLYGPPGTGKSSFGYRIAKALNRHILLIDIMSLSRSALFNIFTNPVIGNVRYNPDEVIYIIDEFDITVEYLYAKKQNNDKKLSPITEYENSNINPEDIIKLLNDEFIKKSNELRLEDLLEILCGPVPTNGAIIIATTNKYERIKEICPALVRPGRLTPVYFGYFTVELFQEMIRYMFGKKFEVPNVTNIIIPQSQIMELIIAAKSIFNNDEEAFEYFCKSFTEIQSCNSQYVLT